MSEVLVIGYGNILRGDDGAGRVVADEVKRWNLPRVKSHSIHQLTPELAEEISQVRMVIFVDASVCCSKFIEIRVIHPQCFNMDLVHTGNPSSLLFLSEYIYGNSPLAYWILIPAVIFDFDESLSSVTSVGVKSALDEIKSLVINSDTV